MFWEIRYTYAYIARAMRALQSSLKTSMRIDDEGLLSMQFLMPGPRRPGRERSQAFIEFWVSAWSVGLRKSLEIIADMILQCLPLEE